jgi:hypothetical protein
MSSRRHRARAAIACWLGLLAACAWCGCSDPRAHDWLGVRPWHAGTRYVYALDADSDVSIDGSGRFMQFHVRGDLNVDVRERDENGATLELRMPAPQIASDMPGRAAAFEAVAPHLKGPYVVHLDARGRADQAWVPDKAHSLAVGILRSLVAAVQISGTADKDVDPAQWDAEEFDNTGRYSASYAHSASGALQKHKTKYLALLTTPSAGDAFKLAPNAEIKASHVDYRFDSAGALAALDANEQVRIATSASPAVSNTLALKLSLRKREPLPASAADPHAGLQALPADRAYLVDAQAGAVAARIGGLSLDDVLSQLRALGPPKPNDDTGMSSRARLFAALRGLFSQSHAQVDAALRAADTDAALSDTVARALATSGDAYAQSKLIDALHAESDPKSAHARSLVVSLSLAEDPSEAASQALIALLDDPVLGTQAAYGVGMHVRQHLGREHPERARALLQVLLDRLAHAQGEIATITLLRAIANASHPDALPAVQTYLHAAAPAVRVSAVEALRNIATPEAGAQLVTALRDSDRDVRKAAAAVAARREPSPELLRALEALARKEHDDHVRYAAIEALVHALPGAPSVRGTLEWIAEHDPQAQHRDKAKAALAAG